jgi:CHAT domain-containing protein/tetratricopeptide (TPR) repeat protein
MLARNSLIAICALSAGYSLLQGLEPPVPAAAVRPAEGTVQSTPPLRILFSPPTQKLVSRQLQAGTVHVYPLPLKARERVEIIAYQDGVDLQAALFDPAGQHLFTVDNSTGSTGAEQIIWVAESSGFHRIEISCNGPCTIGSYRIWIKDEGPATAKDEKDARAESLFYQAKEEIKNRKAPGLNAPDEKLRRAAGLWEDIGNKVRQADALVGLGGFYASQSKWQPALQAFDRARSLYRGVRRIADEGKVDNSIGYVYEMSQDLISAQSNYKHALICGERSHDRSVTAAAYENLGSILRREGRAEEALDSLELARDRWKGLNAMKEAETLISMGGVFLVEGAWMQARAKYHEAFAVAESGADPRNKALALQGMGDIYLKTNEPELALRMYRDALVIQQQEGLLNDMPNSLNGLAAALLNEKRPLDALATFQKALKIFEKQKDQRGQARVLTNLGWTYARLHHDKDAQISYEHALKLAKNLDSWTVAGAMLGLARLEEDRGDPIAAQRQAEAAVKCVEELRAAAGTGFRISYFATKQDVYDALIEILLWKHSIYPALGYDAQALRVSEQARSRGLLDRISSARSTTQSKPSLSSAPVLSLSEIQKSILDSDTLLLEYHLGRKASYLWVVGSSSYRVVNLPSQQQLEGLIDRVSQLLKVSHQREKIWEARRAATDLSHTLLGAAIPWLGRKRLLISAPDALQSVSFVSLPDPSLGDSPSGAHGWPRPLLVEHEVVLIPSASVLAAIRTRAARRKPPQDRLAFLGDPVTDERDERLAGIAGLSASKSKKKASGWLLPNLERLKSTEDEGNAILREAGKRGVLGAFGFDATRELVTSGKLSTFGNIHFASHGWAPPDDASRSALVLSRWDRQGHPVEGLLKASDIYHLDLPANLVVLSACDTGLGERIPGEGIVGLSQAFMGAGATRVMVSLWPVEDRATFKLMESFYHEYLGNGLSPSLALRKAQIAMWEDPNHNAPFYWGGFEIQGDWQWLRDPR